MTETAKTITFVAIAVVAIGVAVLARPSTTPVTEDVVGKPLAPEFTDPLAATSMEIIDYDTETGAPKQFKVAREKGVWSLPSRYGYPADAKEQLATAATSLLDLKILRLVSNIPAEHAEYGVVDPATADASAAGVGKHVILSGEGGKKLLDVIVGKEVKGDTPGLRYVRIAGKSPVYEVKVSTDKLSTRFEDWIEKDLLQLSSWDVSRVFINNYSIDEVNRRQVPGDILDLSYNDKENKWALADLKEGEEVDATKLNALKTALDDLKIVDVRKKPAGLSRDLKTDEGINLDEQTLSSLISKGYYPTQSGDLLSNEGEVVVGTTEGVQYVLRFGEIALGTEEAADDKSGDGDKPEGEAAAAETKADKKEGEEEGEKKEKGANRYLFVMAQFDPSLIKKPELAPIPGETPPEAAPAEQPAADAAPPADEPAESAPADEANPATEPAAEAEAPAQEPSQGPAEPSEEPSTTEPAAVPAETPAETTTEEQPAAPAEPSAPPEAAKTPEEIEQLKIENKRKQDEYDQKVKKGQDKVKQLNDRFADWYYVIPDDTYKKIKLHRAEALKQADPATLPDSPGEFEQLKEGLDAAAPAAAEPAQP